MAEELSVSNAGSASAMGGGKGASDMASNLVPVLLIGVMFFVFGFVTWLNGSLIREGCVDELLVYLAPTLLGDAQGMFALPALTDLKQQRTLRFHQVQQVGEDLRILARFAQRN